MEEVVRLLQSLPKGQSIPEQVHPLLHWMATFDPQDGGRAAYRNQAAERQFLSQFQALQTNFHAAASRFSRPFSILIAAPQPYYLKT